MKKIVMYLMLLISIVVLAGCSTPDEYEVNFEIEDGITIDNDIVIEGDLIMAPVLEDVEGYTFYGWFSNSEYTIIYDFETVIDSDTTLYARWVINMYTYTLILNDWPENDVIATTVPALYGTEFFVMIPPIREGFVFSGWFADEALTENYFLGTILTGDITLYAAWEEIIY